MNVTLNEARETAQAVLEPEWSGPGEFCVSSDAFEDGRYWSLLVGAREYLQDNDLEYATADDTATLVDKVTGELTQPHIDGPLLNRLMLMREANAPTDQD